MAKEEEKRQHIEFIQNIITRLNSNSFMIKGWSITLTSALLALAASTNNNVVLYIALVPIFAFWILDAIYLQNERKFRCLYQETVKDNSSIELYEITTDKDFIKKDPKNSFKEVLCSDTIILFHISLAFLTLVCILFIKFNESEHNAKQQFKININDTIRIKEIDKNDKLHICFDSVKKGNS